jgi:peptide deformylase
MKKKIRLTHSDYKKILEYYKINIPPNISILALKKKAEDALIKKICNCTKKLKSTFRETKAIGVCANSVLRKKKLIYHRFTCKKPAHFIPKSRRLNALHKTTRKNILE